MAGEYVQKVKGKWALFGNQYEKREIKPTTNNVSDNILISEEKDDAHVSHEDSTEREVAEDDLKMNITDKDYINID